MTDLKQEKYSLRDRLSNISDAQIRYWSTLFSTTLLVLFFLVAAFIRFELDIKDLLVIPPTPPPEPSKLIDDSISENLPESTKHDPALDISDDSGASLGTSPEEVEIVGMISDIVSTDVVYLPDVNPKLEVDDNTPRAPGVVEDIDAMPEVEGGLASNPNVESASPQLNLAEAAGGAGMDNNAGGRGILHGGLGLGEGIGKLKGGGGGGNLAGLCTYICENADPELVSQLDIRIIKLINYKAGYCLLADEFTDDDGVVWTIIACADEVSKAVNVSMVEDFAMDGYPHPLHFLVVVFNQELNELEFNGYKRGTIQQSSGSGVTTQLSEGSTMQGSSILARFKEWWKKS